MMLSDVKGELILLFIDGAQIGLIEVKVEIAWRYAMGMCVITKKNIQFLYYC